MRGSATCDYHIFQWHISTSESRWGPHSKYFPSKQPRLLWAGRHHTRISTEGASGLQEPHEPQHGAPSMATPRPSHRSAPPPERALSLNGANPRPAFGRTNQSAFLSQPSLSKPIARRNKRGCRRKRGAGGRLRGARRAGEGRRPGSSVLPPPRVLSGPGRSRGAALWRPPCGPGLPPGGVLLPLSSSWVGPWPGKGLNPSSCGCCVRLRGVGWGCVSV